MDRSKFGISIGKVGICQANKKILPMEVTRTMTQFYLMSVMFYVNGVTR